MFRNEATSLYHGGDAAYNGGAPRRVDEARPPRIVAAVRVPSDNKRGLAYRPCVVEA